MELCTALGSNGFHIQTTEHILAALWGMEIDNVYIEVDSSEVPAMDGSAAPFIQLIHSAGIVQQKIPRTYLKILTPIEVGEGTKKVTILPSTKPLISYTIDFDHHMIQQQSFVHDWSVKSFKEQIAQARTFAFSHEVEALWNRGLGKGGSLENTVVFSDSTILNEEGLRFIDECVRHKVLDLIGDMALLGIRPIGHIIADRSGHNLHTQLARTILQSKEAWTILPAEKSEEDSFVTSSSTDSQNLTSVA
jgi:UDP-3-O-[3-hydroxymyristoyl] N-acetylglucosamine deacetylase